MWHDGKKNQLGNLIYGGDGIPWTSGPFGGFMPTNAIGKPWLTIHPNYVDVNVEVQINDTRSTLKYYKRLVQLRKNLEFTNGGYESKELGDSVCQVRVVINLLISNNIHMETIQ